MKIRWIFLISMLFTTTAMAQSLTPSDKLAQVFIVEFAAFDCPYCAQAHETVQRLLKKYPGKLAIQFKHFPLSNDAAGRLPHEAALAAAQQGRFPDMHNRLFRGRGRQNRAAVERLAQDLKLDMPRFLRDLDAHVGAARIDDDVREARAFGVAVTPTFFVQGYKFEGVVAQETFEQIIDHELNRAATTKLLQSNQSDPGVRQ